MTNYFENLRKRPEAERRKAAFAISLAVTGAILLAWIVSLALRMHAGDFSFKNSANPSAPSLSETFSTFFSGIDSAFKSSGTSTSAQ